VILREGMVGMKVFWVWVISQALRPAMEMDDGVWCLLLIGLGRITEKVHRSRKL